MNAEVQVAFVADNSLLSRAIGNGFFDFWAHMTNYVSPVEVIDARSGSMTIDAQTIKAGVQRRSASYLGKDPYYLAIALPCTPTQRTAWVQALTDQLDKPYDAVGIADTFFGNVDPDWRGHRGWFCNELGLWALEKAGIIRPQYSPAYRFTPGMVCGICMATHGSRLVGYRGDVVADAIRAAGVALPALVT